MREGRRKEEQYLIGSVVLWPLLGKKPCEKSVWCCDGGARLESGRLRHEAHRVTLGQANRMDSIHTLSWPLSNMCSLCPTHFVSSLTYITGLCYGDKGEEGEPRGWIPPASSLHPTKFPSLLQLPTHCGFSPCRSHNPPHGVVFCFLVAKVDQAFPFFSSVEMLAQSDHMYPVLCSLEGRRDTKAHWKCAPFLG